MPNTDEIFDYVMNSPENTNPAVLRSMLNSIEGGGGGVLVVHAVPDTETADTTTLDKTWQEIHDALLSSGAVIFFPDNGQVALITKVGYNTIRRTFGVGSVDETYETDTSDGYPYKNGGK